MPHRDVIGFAALVWLGSIVLCPAQAPPGQAGPDEIVIAELTGPAEILTPGATDWVFTQTNQVLRAGYRFRVGPNTRGALRLADTSVIPFGPSTEIEILPRTESSGLRLLRGILSFFHRDKPGRINIITRGAAAGIEGTEFVLEVVLVGNTERTILSVIDGRVRFENPQGGFSLTNRQQAFAEPGQKPVPTAGFIVNNVLQWAFYYPAVLDLTDLALPPEAEQALAESITAYRSGDLLAALARYPGNRQPQSDAERVYHAAVLLSVGHVVRAEEALADLRVTNMDDRDQRLATALRTLIAAVKRDPRPGTRDPELATELLAASYYEQSRALGDESLNAALRLARRATVVSPGFGFAWARVAELEFSFGRSSKALEALNRALDLTPRNAQAHALHGFLLAGRNQTRKALASFDQAMAIDSGLGNAWLGRGLTRIRRGESKLGREDLLIAAAIEPRRAVLRSYLAKAFADAGQRDFALHELELAKEIDPADPTGLLYSALIKQQQNRINEAVEDLEHSQDLNENRSLYRSQLLLDQDRAVRSANLASIYRDAGMQDWSVYEASRAVSADYANYSAHLFLANSYNELRDPNRINLRYETPAEAEYLIANLLAPVGAGLLSSTISAQEDSRLFERDRLGLVSSTEYLSRGAWLQQGAQYGTFKNSAYALEALYRSDPGQRPNNDFEERDLRLQLKQQLTPQDTVWAQGIYYEASGGDLFQLYDPSQYNPGLRIRENQDPILAIGYHHEWSPGVHTLALAGRLSDRFSVANPEQFTFLVGRRTATNGTELVRVEPFAVKQEYRSILETYSGELQQIWQSPKHTLILGGRIQAGGFETSNLQQDPATSTIGIIPTSETPVAQQQVTSDFERASLYGYYSWNVASALTLVAGVSYDYLRFPENHRNAPVFSNEVTEEQLSPKAGLIWTLSRNAVARAAYTKSLGGASLDQSFHLEPTHVAGFLQSFRSILPESLGGAKPAAEFETYGVALEQKLGAGSYISIVGEALGSEIDRTFGAFGQISGGMAHTNIMGVRNLLDYSERSLAVTFNQLLADRWVAGVRYRISEADLDNVYPEFPNTTMLINNFRLRDNLEATLHQLNLNLLFHHETGFFSQAEAHWYSQDNRGYSPALSDEHFWQFNLIAGYRFPARKAELQIGVLNLTDQDYRLNPLTLYQELPRERTLAIRWQMRF